MIGNNYVRFPVPSLALTNGLTGTCFLSSLDGYLQCFKKRQSLQGKKPHRFPHVYVQVRACMHSLLLVIIIVLNFIMYQLSQDTAYLNYLDALSQSLQH